MELNLDTIITSIIPQLGFGAIFLYFYRQERAENKVNIKERDERIKELTDKLTGAFEKNAETTQAVKDALIGNTNAIDRNTIGLQSLSEKIYNAVTGKINGSNT